MTSFQAALSPDATRDQAARGIPRRPLKRCFDLVTASVLLVLLLPLMVIISVLIRATSPGPAFFRQTRLGRGECSFVMLKFRTMQHGCSEEPHHEYVRSLLSKERQLPVAGAPEEGGPGLFKLTADPRVTRVGAWLRKSSLDELPQLINVLRGEMSIVGPRPVLALEADYFEVPQRLRFAVRPGLTGLWQVSGRSQVSFVEQLNLDVRYVEEQSMRLDLAILLRTLPSLMSGQTR